MIVGAQSTCRLGAGHAVPLEAATFVGQMDDASAATLSETRWPVPTHGTDVHVICECASRPLVLCVQGAGAEAVKTPKVSSEPDAPPYCTVMP